MRLVLSVLAIASGLTIGCGSQSLQNTYTNVSGVQSGTINVPVYIDNQFSIQEKIEIGKAISDWNYVLNGYYHLSIDETNPTAMTDSFFVKARDNGSIVIIKSKSDDPMILRSNIENVGGITYPYGRSAPSSLIYIVSEKTGLDKIRYIVAHEIGHSYRSEDMDDDSLMSYHYQGPRCIDKETVMQVAKHMHLDFSKLNYCGE